MRLWIISLFLLLSGCQSPQIHIINDGYSAQAINKFTDAVEDKGFRVRHSKVRMPAEFSPTSIAINPAFADIERLEQLHTLLAESGFGVASEYRFAQGRHFYTPGHVGLYLRSPSTLSAPHMPPYVRTQLCEFADASIQFNEDGSLILEYEVARADDFELIKTVGEWRLKETELMLTLAGQQRQQFARSQQTQPTHLGPRTADIFTPISATHAFAILNCTFVIIYMDE